MEYSSSGCAADTVCMCLALCGSWWGGGYQAMALCFCIKYPSWMCVLHCKDLCQKGWEGG